MGTGCSVVGGSRPEVADGQRLSAIFDTDHHALYMISHSSESVVSAVDAHLLRRMWPCGSLEQSYELGLEIYEQIFRLEPETRRFFGCLHSLPANQRLRHVPEFQNQIYRFLNVWTMCVNHSDQRHYMDDRLFELGRRHRYYVPNAEMKHFRLFETAFAMAMRRRVEEMPTVEEDLDSENTEFSHPASPTERSGLQTIFRNNKDKLRAVIAWTALAAYAVRQIVAGYQSQQNDDRSDGAKYVTKPS